MFRRELELAIGCGEEMRRRLEAAAEAPGIHDVSAHVRAALDAAWRMESALGQFVALDPHKQRAANLAEAVGTARRAFDELKPALAGLDGLPRRSEAEMKSWVNRFRPRADEVLATASEARRRAPRASSHRISAPVGEATLERARAVVSIARTGNWNLDVLDVEVLLGRALEPLGGIARFVRPGQTVLLKPNQTLLVLWDEGSTTDPRVVAALTRMCYAAGAAKVVVGESAGGGSKTGQVMESTGVATLARWAGAEVVDFHTCPQRMVEVPQGKVIRRLLLPEPLLEADVVINSPKLKTHNWDWISGALKNWVGIVRPDVREEHHDAQTYDEYVDLFFRVPAHLSVMDAIYRGVGNGPGANVGDFYGGILASVDPVALDAVAAQVLGFDPTSIGFIEVAKERHLGVGDPNEIAVVGVPLREAVVPGEPPAMGVDVYDANVIVGTGLTRAGTLGHFKSMGDIFQAMGVWTVIRLLHGRPTILIGDAEDPLFGDHLRAGPYVVLDDAAPAQYKYHPDVYFVPGHPVLHNLEKELLKGLRILPLGDAALWAMGRVRLIEARLQTRLPKPLMPIARAAIVVGRQLPIPAQVAIVGGAAGLVLAGLAVAAGRALAHERSLPSSGIRAPRIGLGGRGPEPPSARPLSWPKMALPLVAPVLAAVVASRVSARRSARTRPASASRPAAEHRARL